MRTVAKRINPAFKQTQPLPLLSAAMLEQLSSPTRGCNRFLQQNGMMSPGGLDQADNGLSGRVAVSAAASSPQG